MIDVKFWSLDKDGSNNIIPSELESLIQTETEQQLEDLIVKNPNLLMDNLKLVGRQTPTASGALDLLGVDNNGHFYISKDLFFRVNCVKLNLAY
jgi:RecB family endonuclease NucS